MGMTPRERVARMLAGKETDRVPVDFGGTVVTCLDLHAHRKLKKHFGIPEGEDPIIDYTMGTVEPCEELKVRFGSDFRRVSLNGGNPGIIGHEFRNGFGIRMRQALPHEYFDVVGSPLAEAELDDLDRMEMPDPDAPELYAGLRERTKRLYDDTPYAIVADFGVPGFYETSQKLRGYENLACDLLIDRTFVTALYDRLLELQKRYFKNYLAAVGKYAQVIGYADDLGMQDRLQMSPETYRDVIKPYHRKIFAFIHEHTDARILLHSCGAVTPVIDDLIEVGVDILNPVQTRAKGMDPETLKSSFGKRIMFWGGVDEQQLLPRGTPEEVAEEVVRLMAVLGEGGGYVLAPGHNLQTDTPVENIVAMYDTAKRVNKASEEIWNQSGQMGKGART
jgi:uroporphyrinogen decarboxylase